MRVLDLYPWIETDFDDVKEIHDTRCTAACPIKCHRNARMQFSLGEENRLLVKCWAGCDVLEALRARGHKWADCFQGGKMPERVKQEITARYQYRDENGKLLYQTIRLEPGRGGRDKDFRQRRPVPGPVPGCPREWIYNLEGCPRVLYRLPELLAAPRTDPVWIVAGEKDADNLARLGFVSTTNVCGERAEWLESYSAALAGRDVIVVEDRDSAGKRHCHEVRGSLMDYARSIRRVQFPLKDATAFLMSLRANDVTAPADLRAYVEGAADEVPVWRAETFHSQR